MIVVISYASFWKEAQPGNTPDIKPDRYIYRE